MLNKKYYKLSEIIKSNLFPIKAVFKNVPEWFEVFVNFPGHPKQNRNSFYTIILKIPIGMEHLETYEIVYRPN